MYCYTYYLLYNYVHIGATPAQSKWMDGIAVKWAGSQCLVKDLDGNREHGLYHQMRGHELSNFIAEISVLQLWGFDCINNAVSAGKVYEVQPGGVGSLCMIHTWIGPFM